MRPTAAPHALLARSLALLALSAPPAPALPPPGPSGGQVVLGAPATPGSRGAVASESEVCSRIGIDLLDRGGNAVDAYVGTQLCVGVVAMYHSGAGGGGFTLLRDGAGRYVALDYRETAPAAAHEDMFRGNVAGSVVGGLAAGVPGELRGLQAAHDALGALAWRDVVMPAVGVARGGFAVTDDLVRYMAAGVAYAGWNFLVEDPSWAQDFAPHGRLVQLGDTMFRTRYADTLEKIADGGADAFYRGPIAEATIATVQAANGSMTLDDLAGYRAVARRPLSIDYRGRRIWSAGVPSSGAVALGTLQTVAGYDEDAADGNLTLHRFDEALRFAYAARQRLGDPDFAPGAEAVEDEQLSTAAAAARRRRILDNTTQPVAHYRPGDGYASCSGGGTSHVAAADASGMAASGTTTINLLFGNLQMVPATGVVLNNDMNDFGIPGVRNEFGYPPAAANRIRPGKRPLSSIAPVVVEDAASGRLVAVAGAAGGSRIVSSTAQVVWHLLQHDMDMGASVRAPRLHDQLMPDEAWFEWSFDNHTVAAMRERGHQVRWVREGLSAVQGIRLGDDGIFEAVGEPRQENSAGLTL